MLHYNLCNFPTLIPPSQGRKIVYAYDERCDAGAIEINHMHGLIHQLTVGSIKK